LESDLSRWRLKAGGFKGAGFALAVVVLCLVLAAGCGLETDKANDELKKANAHQREAEAVMARLKVLPNDWQNIFSTATIGPDQVAKARELLKAREADVDALDAALKNWSFDINAISKLNVEEKIKEYVKLKSASIRQWQDYSEMYLRPLVKAYGGLLETIAMGRPLTEQQKAAADITNLVSESTQKLEECLNSEKQADNFFKTNKLGD
jgi:hypothetical protein